MWTGIISDKEIVRGTGLIDFFEEGDALMADIFFLIFAYTQTNSFSFLCTFSGLQTVSKNSHFVFSVCFFIEVS